MSIIERFWVLDFDRCLARSTVLYDVFVDIIDQRGIINPERLMYARRKTEASGGSFDMVSYLFKERLITEAVFLDVAEAFRKQVVTRPSDVLEEGAAEFLSYLKDMGRPFAIMSYGNPRWQNLKIAASGLGDVPRMIVPNRYKGLSIASWHLPNRATFSLPTELGESGVLTREVVLIDDKAAAFKGLPEQARGYWLQLSSTLLPSQMGDVPGNVTIVRNYTDIINSEEGRR